MKLIKKILAASLFCLMAAGLCAVELVPTQDLLAAYLEQDSDLKNLAIELEKAQLSQTGTEIDNGFDISLSTGSMTFVFGDNSSFKVSPSVRAELPSLSGLSAGVSSDMSFGSSGSSINNTSIDVSVNILGSSGLNREISLQKADRTVLEAQRAITKKALEKEKTFYSSLSSLLSTISSIITKQKTYYDDKITFESIKAQGYSKSSSTYRRDEMTVLSDQHEIENLEHTLISDYKIFYMNCGQTIDIPSDIDFMELIPTDIPVVEAEDMSSYPEEKYTEIESAVWTNKINSLSREATKHYSLSANAGYTIKNSSTNSDSVDFGLSGAYGGVGLSAGVSIPVASEKSSPALNMSVSVSPNTFRKNTITDKTNELTQKEELLKIQTARTNYETTLEEMKLQKEDILWNRSTNDENYITYAALEKDMYNWYRQGITTESEYLAAKVNLQSSSVKKITNLIDMIVYNDSVKMLFTE